MSTRAETVVAGVDGSGAGRRAAAWAARHAASRGLSLRLVHALRLPALDRDNPLTGYDVTCERLRELAVRWLAQAERAARDAVPDLLVRTALVVGEPVAVLRDQSRDADLLVLGAGPAGPRTGRIAVTLAAHGSCPLVVVPLRTATPRGPVVVGVDGSPASESALGFAFAEAAARGCALVAVHTWSDAQGLGVPGLSDADRDWTAVRAGEHRLLAERLAGWHEQYPDVPVRRVVTLDRPARSLAAEAAHARLLVVGTRGRGGFQGMLLGSTSQALLHQPPCPVAVVRPAPVASESPDARDAAEVRGARASR